MGNESMTHPRAVPRWIALFTSVGLLGLYPSLYLASVVFAARTIVRTTPTIEEKLSIAAARLASEPLV